MADYGIFCLWPVIYIWLTPGLPMDITIWTHLIVLSQTLHHCIPDDIRNWTFDSNKNQLHTFVLKMNRMLIRSEVEHFIHLTWAVLVTGQTGSGSVWNVPSWGCADCLWLLQNRLTGLKTLSPKMTCVGFGLNFYLENYNIPMYWVKSYTSL